MRAAIVLSLVLSTAAAAAEDRFFESAGVRIRYIEAGQGPPVVLIHGYTGDLDRHFVNPGVVSALAKDYRVIAMDCRGHGKSGKPHEPAAYGAEMARDVVRLLDHLSISRAQIVGYSMGAIIAAKLVTTMPDRVSSVVLVGQSGSYMPTAAETEAAAAELESETPFLGLVRALWPRDTPPPTDAEMRALTSRLAAANDVRALAAYYRATPSLSVSIPELAAVRTPMLAVIGTLDPGLASVNELKAAKPSLTTTILEGAEHGGERGILRRPEAVESIRVFLAANR